MPKQIPLNQQERGELVLRLLRREKTARELALEAGISDQVLHRWREQFVSGGIQNLAVGKSGRTKEERLQKEISERDRLLGEMTVAMSVLKKTSGISS